MFGLGELGEAELQIVGLGIHDDELRAFLLQPSSRVPEPAAASLFAAALAGLWLQTRRDARA